MFIMMFFNIIVLVCQILVYFLNYLPFYTHKREHAITLHIQYVIFFLYHPPRIVIYSIAAWGPGPARIAWMEYETMSSEWPSFEHVMVDARLWLAEHVFLVGDLKRWPIRALESRSFRFRGRRSGIPARDRHGRLPEERGNAYGFQDYYRLISL